MAIQIGRIISRYCLVTTVPTFVVFSIYSDISYTREYKKKLAEAKNAEHYS